jgi:two-component system response regulator HupR/HoxA
MTPLPTVLVIDDEVRSQEALRRTLEEDFEVYTASSAAEARGIMERQSVQVVLTDQRMPEVSGVEFLKEVRRAWPDTVRIIISGYTDSEDIIAGINEAGIYQYLLKPWHPEQLLLTLKRAAELLPPATGELPARGGTARRRAGAAGTGGGHPPARQAGLRPWTTWCAPKAAR